MSRFSVLCLDMAGTTVRDGKTVIESFASAIALHNLPVREFNTAMKYAQATMGQSKIEVFRHIFGDEERAQAANAAFEKHYAHAVFDGKVAPMPGAEELFAACRELGIKTVAVHSTAAVSTSPVSTISSRRSNASRP